MHPDNNRVPSCLRACVAGVGLMLVLTTMLPAAQAAKLATSGPCISTGGGGAGIDECNYGFGLANDLMSGNHATASGAASFSEANATAVLEDVRVTWTFNESKVDANVTAFHVQRGLDPTLPRTMEPVATVGPQADAYHDENAMTSGDVWYVVSAEMADGSIEHSQPFRVNGAHLG